MIDMPLDTDAIEDETPAGPPPPRDFLTEAVLASGKTMPEYVSSLAQVGILQQLTRIADMMAAAREDAPSVTVSVTRKSRPDHDHKEISMTGAGHFLAAEAHLADVESIVAGTLAASPVRRIEFGRLHASLAHTAVIAAGMLNDMPDAERAGWAVILDPNGEPYAGFDPC